MTDTRPSPKAIRAAACAMCRAVMKELSRKPQMINEQTWYYEEPRGLLVVREVRDGAGDMIAPVQLFRLSWGKLAASVDRWRALRASGEQR